MTREKEIELAMKDSVAETIFASGWGITPQATDLLECAFIKGAEWADANPQFSKEEFIDKACEWLELHINDDKYYSCIGEETLISYLIEDFRKIMEE